MGGKTNGTREGEIVKSTIIVGDFYTSNSNGEYLISSWKLQYI